ncbi:hypothetical protein INT47_006504 [Mucor saturninus]|uniref:Homeodomain-like DNA binding domain-containing transcription factor n=1 Tax=Mucor saturninus TaxID=64648 RepID=A0A8H7QE61_9FUNG|nr:hypothetical protein INT47_006504 [Mucor saturninus]
MTLTDTTNNTPKRPDQIITDIRLAMSIPRSTIVDCVSRWEETGIGISETRKVEQPKLSERDQRAVVSSFRKEPFMPFVAHKEKLKTAGVDIHRQSLSKYASINEFSSYSPAYLPELTPRHM